MNLKKWLLVIGVSTLATFGTGCGGGTPAPPAQPAAQTGSAFVIGTDAPLPSVVGYLNVANPPTRPTISTLNATSTPAVSLTTSSVTITLASPLVVNAGDIDGLKFDFDLRQSIQLDANGQLTGVVNPHLDLKAITPSDADAYIDEFDAGVISTNAGGNSFPDSGTAWSPVHCERHRSNGI
jgi:hypothetical protein